MTIYTHTNNIKIRPMRMGDMQEVQEIDRISFSLPWPASAYDYELNKNPHSLLRVAEKRLSKMAKRVVGMIVVWQILDEAHIASLAVHPKYRNQGVASLLLSTTLEETILQGADLATLEVRALNFQAQRLYKSFKFEVVARRLRYYLDNGEDGLIMTVNNLDRNYLSWLETL